MTASTLVERLEHCKPAGDGEWLARCPAHEDKSPSLSVKECQDGRVLVNCFAGCSALDVITAVGLEWPDLFPPDTNYHATRKQRQETVDELVIEIARSDMARGLRLEGKDLERYQLALLRANKLEGVV